MLGSFTSEHVQDNANDQQNFKFLHETNNDISIYDKSGHNCIYYEPDKFFEKTAELKSVAFSIFSLNIRSLPGKWNEFQNFLSTNIAKGFKFDILALQEIWSVPGRFDLPGYSQLHFTVREKGLVNRNAGGGVGLWVADSLKFEPIPELSIFIPHVFESQFIKVHTGANCFKIVGNIYRPNTGKLACIKTFNKTLSGLISKIKNEKNLCNRELILVGDSNINLINYELHKDTNDYLEILLSNELLPLVTLPTRISQRSASLIDHISTNRNDSSYDVGIIINDLSDHFATFYIIHDNSKEKCKTILSKRFSRVMNASNKLKFKNKLENTDWNIVYENFETDSAYNSFLRQLDYCFEASFPIKKENIPKRSIPLNPWMTKGLLISRRKKELLYRKQLRSPLPESIASYKSFNNLYNRLCRAAKKQYYHSKFTEFSMDGKKTWQLVNTVLGRTFNKCTLPEKFVSNGKVLSGDYEIAEGFNNFFSDIGPSLANKIPESKLSFADFLNNRVDNSFTFQNVTPEVLLFALDKMKNKNSSGNDNISTNLLKYSIDPLILPLCHLYNLSFKSGVVPMSLKTAKCIPIFKSGDPGDFSNYRPISLLSTFAKLQEKIVAIQMIRFLNKFKILYEHQYGFRAKHNTQHPLVQFLGKINDSLNRNTPEYTLGIFIDLKKAFDTCDKNILLAKLNHYGFRGTVNCWFHSYLSNRRQYTVINETSSSMREMNCGVPQGSILGPLLFVLLINDLSNSSRLLFVLLFADDTTLQLSSSNIKELFKIANKELNVVSDWFKANKLTLNVNKTKYILFRKQNMTPNLNNLSLIIDNSEIERIGKDCKDNSFKFVGVHIDEFLSWKDHIKHVNSKLASSTFALSKVRNVLPEKTKLLIYNSLFRSHLEYCIIAWGKSNNSQMSKLQSLQKKCLRYVANVRINAHVNPLFLKYNLLNVSDTVDYNLGIFMYQHTYGGLPISFENFFQKLHSHDRNLNYMIAGVKYAHLKSIPVNSIPMFWNSLSLDMKRSTSIHSFKTKLSDYLQLNYTIPCKKQNCYSCQ